MRFHRALGRALFSFLPLLGWQVAEEPLPVGGSIARPKRTRFVEPRLVCDVEFVEYTQARTLRAPSYKGLRDDVDPESVGFDPGA